MKTRPYLFGILLLVSPFVSGCFSKGKVETSTQTTLGPNDSGSVKIIEGNLTLKGTEFPLDSVEVYIPGHGSSVFSDSEGYYALPSLGLDTVDLQFKRWGLTSILIKKYPVSEMGPYHLEIMPSFGKTDTICPICKKSDRVIPLVSESQENQELEAQGLVKVYRPTTSVSPPNSFCKRDQVIF